jgi:hypothetical protein
MDKKCKRCDNLFTQQKGLINYCSMTCRNTRHHSNETKAKIKNSLVKFHTVNTGSYTNGNKKTNPDYWNKISKTRIANYNRQLLAEPFINLKYERLRKRVFLEQNNKCKHCGINEWNNKPIILELDHIDGDNSNNIRNNLVGICPNCHSQTDTWRGRNKKNRVPYKVSDEQILNALIKHNWNMRQSLLEIGLSAKGGNYKRCHRLKREFNDLN